MTEKDALRSDACTTCGATPETGQSDECSECQGITEPLKGAKSIDGWGSAA